MRQAFRYNLKRQEYGFVYRRAHGPKQSLKLVCVVALSAFLITGISTAAMTV